MNNGLNIKGVVAVLSVFVSISALATDAAFGSEITTAFGKNATIIIAGIGIVGAVAGKIITALANFGTNNSTTLVATIVPPSSTNSVPPKS